jgi:hypothetical protein
MIEIKKDGIYLQTCNECGREFYIQYNKNGSYEYLEDTCDCESSFSPASAEVPSISQWLIAIKSE